MFNDHSVIQSFDMKRLETEYDYETDVEQQTRMASWLGRELKQAIEYFVVEDPLECNFVSNIRL